MKILLVQLSDCHFQSDEASNHLLKKVSDLAGAIASCCISADHCILLFSGDIAYSGGRDQFSHASVFVSDIESSLQSAAPSVSVTKIAVPGNHDCDFSSNDTVRNVLLDNMNADSLADQSVRDTCTKVQDEFFAWVTELDPDDPSPFSDRHLHIRDCKFGNETARFILLNSAWCSRLKEVQGTLEYPVDLLTQKLSDGQNPEVAISVIHHPYNWFKSSNARSLRMVLEGNSDMVLTGHEHVADVFRKTGSDGEQNDYIEGGVLQEHGSSDSTFNTVLINTKTQEQETKRYVYEDNGYQLVEDGVVSRPFERNKRRLRNQFALNEKFEYEILEDVGVNFAHPRVENLKLSQIFVYPDAKKIKKKADDKSSGLVKSRDVVSYILEHKKCLVFGDEQSGKTSFSRMLFQDLKRGGLVPVLASGLDFKSMDDGRIRKTLDDLCESQYSSFSESEFWGLSFDKRAIVIDDFDKCKIQKSKRDELLTKLEAQFGTVVLLGSSGMRFDLLSGASEDVHALWSYHSVELLELGHVRRHEVIQKWLRAGQGEVADEIDLELQLVRLESVISSMLIRDVLPSHPIFVLILLQALEHSSNIKLASGSFGYLYEQLITSSLLKAGGSSTHIDTLYSYLSDFSAALSEKEMEGLSEYEMKEWHSRYCERMGLDLSYERVIRGLVSNRILGESSGTIGFRYPFLRYYFIARHYSQNIDQLAVRTKISSLASKLYHEGSAHTMMFLCHVCKDDFVLDEILRVAKSLFDKSAPCKFGDDVEFLNAISYPDSIHLPESKASENREQMLESMDEIDHQESLVESSKTEDNEIDLTDEESVAVFMANLNASGKTVQILGQILRTFVGSLTQARKLEIAKECYALGMRTLGTVFSAIEDNKDEMADQYYHWLKKTNPKWKDEKLKKVASHAVNNLTEVYALGSIKHISSSVGLRELSPTFSQIVKDDDSMANKLIDLSIKLDNLGAFPESEIRAIQKQCGEHGFNRAVLRGFVWMHFYLYPMSDTPTKQSICSLLGISYQPRLPGNAMARV